MATAPGQPSREVERLSRVRTAVLVLIGLVVVLLLLSALGAQVGTATLVVLVCAALVAYVALRLLNRSSS
jgi:Flp pilus assembly protein TadB